MFYSLLVFLTIGCGEDADEQDLEQDLEQEVEMYSCNLFDYGICFDYYTQDGWDYTKSKDNCDYLSSEYNSPITFNDDGNGCNVSPTVGLCVLPPTGDFEHAVFSYYHETLWTVDEAEIACSDAGGSFE